MLRPCGCSQQEAQTGELVTTTSSLKAIGLSLDDSSLGSEEAEVESCVTQEPDLEDQYGEMLEETSSEHQDPPCEHLAKLASMAAQHRVASVVSLESEDILRATSIRSILHNGARILQSSVGSEATYLQSSTTKWIDVFISHNWEVPRRKKFWALCLHFNVALAMVAAYVGVALGCMLNALAVSPALQGPGYVLRPYCLILGSCGFFLALTMGHDLPLVGRLLSRQKLFLDKVCIHQTDPDLKAAGIKNLGAFLSHSKKLLVLFNGLYCKKLWTVYEVACFMYLHRRDKLELLPVDIAEVALQSTALIMIVHGLSVVAMLDIFGDVVRGLVASCSGVVCIVTLAFILRRWALQQSELFSDLQSFQIARARCADESDRAVVSANIGSFVRAMGLVEEETDEAEALLSFDRLVQESMPEMLRSAIGRTGFPYRYAFVAGTAFDFYAFDIISSQNYEDISVPFVLTWLLYSLNLRAVVMPAVFFICARMGRTCPRRKSRCAEVALSFSTAALAIVVMMILFQLAALFRGRAVDSPSALLAFFAVSAAEILAVTKLFRSRPKGSPAALCVQVNDAEMQVRDAHDAEMQVHDAEMQVCDAEMQACDTEISV